MQRRLAIRAAERQAPGAVSGHAGIEIGDRVVHLQVPGVFTVVGRRGPFLHVESPRGLRMTVHETGVRRVEGVPPPPKDA